MMRKVSPVVHVSFASSKRLAIARVPTPDRRCISAVAIGMQLSPSPNNAQQAGVTTCRFKKKKVTIQHTVVSMLHTFTRNSGAVFLWSMRAAHFRRYLSCSLRR